MGPRHDDRGEQGLPMTVHCNCSMLQWGRGTMTAENYRQLRPQQSHVLASMGPRHDDRGEPRTTCRSRCTARLQWGRGTMTAENRTRWRNSRAKNVRLQWGRGTMTAENLAPVFGATLI